MAGLSKLRVCPGADTVAQSSRCGQGKAIRSRARPSARLTWNGTETADGSSFRQGQMTRRRTSLRSGKVKLSHAVGSNCRLSTTRRKRFTRESPHCTGHRDAFPRQLHVGLASVCMGCKTSLTPASVAHHHIDGCCAPSVVRHAQGSDESKIR